MKQEHISVKTLFLLIGAGAAFSMLALSVVLSIMTRDIWVLIGGGLLTACALVWLFLLTQFFGKRLSLFTLDLCRTMDSIRHMFCQEVSWPLETLPQLQKTLHSDRQYLQF